MLIAVLKLIPALAVGIFLVGFPFAYLNWVSLMHGYWLNLFGEDIHRLGWAFSIITTGASMFFLTAFAASMVRDIAAEAEGEVK